MSDSASRTGVVAAIQDRFTRGPTHPRINLSFEDAMFILRNQRRRWVIRLLNASSDPVPLRDLANDIHLLEQDVAFDRLDDAERDGGWKPRKAVYIALYQDHIPKLHDLDIVENEDGVIHPGENHEAAAALITTIRTDWLTPTAPEVSD